ALAETGRDGVRPPHGWGAATPAGEGAVGVRGDLHRDAAPEDRRLAHRGGARRGTRAARGDAHGHDPLDGRSRKDPAEGGRGARLRWASAIEGRRRLPVERPGCGSSGARTSARRTSPTPTSRTGKR